MTGSRIGIHRRQLVAVAAVAIARAGVELLAHLGVRFVASFHLLLRALQRRGVILKI